MAFLPLIVLSLLAVSHVCAGQLSIPSFTASPGDITSVDVIYTAQGTQIAAIQFDLEFDPSLTVTAVVARAGLVSGKFLTTAELGTGKQRFLLYGFNQLQIADGALVSLTIVAPFGYAAIPSPLRLSNSLGADKDAVTIPISTSDGTAQPNGGTTTGLRFVPLLPCRLLETRTAYNFEGRSGPFGPPSLTAGGIRTLNPKASELCAVPQAAKAYIVNITVVPHGRLSSVTVWPAGEPQPGVWTIRSPDGTVAVNSAIVKAGSGDSISMRATDETDILMDISGYFTDNAAVSNLVFYPLPPCRLVDTRSQYRSPPGPFGPPSLAARVSRTITMSASPYCVLPAAKAYSVTLTAVPQGPLQFVTIWPSGGSQPQVSSINSPAARVLANSLILPVSADGSVDVYAFDTTDLLMDVNGYFAADDGRTGLLYFPVTQCRASDSSVAGGAFADDSLRTIVFPTAAGCTGVAANALAYAINVTAIPDGSPMPYLTVYPTGQSRPNASILNAFEGQTITNSAIVPAGVNGAIDVYANRRTNVVVELSGYFGR